MVSVNVHQFSTISRVTVERGTHCADAASDLFLVKLSKTTITFPISTYPFSKPLISVIYDYYNFLRSPLFTTHGPLFFLVFIVFRHVN